MNGFIRELRRRAVFRTVGLYVGACWLLIEAASVLLPAFESPQWVLRGLIVVAIVGFPVVAVFAWIYDINERGITRDTDQTSVPSFGGRRMDFVVIGVLSIALIFSLYVNFRAGPIEVTEREDISVLVADFQNGTNDPLFDGSLEQALQIGIEDASFVTVYHREAARTLATELQSASRLDTSAAQLVAVREGIKLVLAGSINIDGGGYDLSVSVIDPRNGSVLAKADADAENKLDVLAAVGLLAIDLREALGDESLDREQLVVSETFTASSLEAAWEYGRAQALQYNANFAEAILYYQRAIEHDASFGRAYSGWAVAARSLGRIEESNGAWEQALVHLDTMTEREQLRTLGGYYSDVTRNYQKAIESYETLVDKYPADYVGHNNLAVGYFRMLDFRSALGEGRAALEIYPDNTVMGSNYALYAMYASDFDTAVREANRVRELGSNFFKAWLPTAMKAMSDGDLDAARHAYRSMVESSARGASTGNLGLADVDIYSGDFAAARDLLLDGIAADEAAENSYGMAAKYMALAEALFHLGEQSAALDALDEGLALTDTEAAVVPAGLMYIEVGREDSAASIAETLSRKLQPQSRAYAELIRAMIDLKSGRHVEALDRLNAALALADLWLVRCYLGRAYLENGLFAEAFDELMHCGNRLGEATAVFLDDMPTYRYLATLPYWLARAQQELGMANAAVENYNKFIVRRPAEDSLADDARRRSQ